MGIFDDTFSIELNHPIDEESWKVITDAELDKTEHIYFTTPSSKRVDFIKADVLDKIRAEIEQKARPNELGGRGNGKSIRYGLCIALEIIDKYKLESKE